MYIYFNKLGELTTIIPHGEIVRQGTWFTLNVALDEDVDISNANMNFRFKRRGNERFVGDENYQGNFVMIKDGVQTFHKLDPKEATFDLVDGKDYKVFTYKVNTDTGLTSIDGNVEIVFTLTEQVTNEASQEITEDVKMQGRANIYVEPTYGLHPERGLDLSVSEYATIMQSINEIQNSYKVKNIDIVHTTNAIGDDLYNVTITYNDKAKVTFDSSYLKSYLADATVDTDTMSMTIKKSDGTVLYFEGLTSDKVLQIIAENSIIGDITYSVKKSTDEVDLDSDEQLLTAKATNENIGGVLIVLDGSVTGGTISAQHLAILKENTNAKLVYKGYVFQLFDIAEGSQLYHTMNSESEDFIQVNDDGTWTYWEVTFDLGQLKDEIAQVEQELGNKLDKVTSSASYFRAYVVNKSGVQGTLFIADEAGVGGALVRRTNDGQIKGVTPTENDDVANKAYVDSKSSYRLNLTATSGTITQEQYNALSADSKSYIVVTISGEATTYNKISSSSANLVFASSVSSTGAYKVITITPNLNYVGSSVATEILANKVQTLDSNSTNATYPSSKAVVDFALAKVATSDTNTRVYVVNPNGTQAMVVASTTALANSIALRNANGQLETANATADNHAINKGQFDTAMAKKADLVDGKVPLSQLPASMLQEIITLPTRSDFPEQGKPNTLYIAKDTGLQYIWTDGEYMQVGGSQLVIGTTTGTAYDGGKGQANRDDIDAILNGTKSAKKAEQDASGNNIEDTYATKTSLSGKLDKVIGTTTKQQAYVKEAGGTQAMEDISDGTDNGTIVKRTSTGTIKGASATTDEELTTLAQVNGLVDGKLDKSEGTSGRIVLYGVAPGAVQTTYVLSDTPVPHSVPYRDATGNITTVSAINSNDVTPKSYVDTGLGTKLDKVTGTTTRDQAYIKSSDGSQKMVDIDTSATGGTLAKRNSDGTITASSGTATNSVVTVGQLNDSIKTVTISEVSLTGTSGTITNEQLVVLNANKNNYIVCDTVKFYYAQADDSTMVYSATSYTDGQKSSQSITIDKTTRAWTLATIKETSEIPTLDALPDPVTDDTPSLFIYDTKLYYKTDVEEDTKVYGIDGVGRESTTLTRTEDNVELTSSSQELHDFFVSSEDVTDSNGNHFVELKKFYLKITQNSDGSFKYQVSHTKIDDTYFVHPYFFDKDGNEIDYAYYGKYKGYVSSNVLKSESNVTPTYGNPVQAYTNYGRNNGTKQYFSTDWASVLLMQIMFMIVHATTKWDSVFTMRSTKSITSRGGTASTFFGIEDAVGNGFEWVDGLTKAKTNNVYYKNYVGEYAGEITKGNYFTGIATTSGYQTKHLYVENLLVSNIFPSEVGGTSTTYYGDNFTYSSVDGSAIYWGGTNGVFFIRCYDAYVVRNDSAGSRLHTKELI